MKIPGQMRRYVTGWQLELAWESPQASTWRLTGPAGRRRYLKRVPAGAAVTLRGEAARMRWAAQAGLPVPPVIVACAAGQAEWLLTDALPGTNAVESDLRRDPAALVPVLAAGLRRFHLAPTESCPFPFRIENALARVRQRVAAGLIDGAAMHPEHAHLNPEAALAELERLRPESEDLVVCHGDYCLPNVLISGDRATGFVDLGELGVADRWRDLAIGTWSVTWNLGPGWEDEFLASYGAGRDDRRTAFYRLLYDMTS
jgi:aminoglycoside phosphotransferase